MFKQLKGESKICIPLYLSKDENPTHTINFNLSTPIGGPTLDDETYYGQVYWESVINSFGFNRCPE